MRTALETLLKSQDHRLERRIVLGLLLALALTLVIHIFSSTSIRHLLASDEKVMFNFELDNHLEDLDHELISMESNLRSYIISNASGLLGDLGSNMAEAREKLERIATMSADLPEVPGGVDRLRGLVEKKISFSEAVLDSFSRSGEDAAIRLINTREGLRLRDSIIRITSELRQLERQNITQTIAINRSEAQEVSQIDYLSTLLATGIVLLALFYFLRSIEYRKATQLKLEEARLEAEHSARVKEQFLANMSHEIRTPLHAVMSFSEMMAATPLNSRQQELAEGIQLSGENLLTTVNDILDFSKLEAGMVHLEQIPFRLSESWQYLEKIFRVKAEAKGLELHFNQFSLSSPMLLGDPSRLHQIMINLIGNALKFTEEGGVQIWGHLHQSAPDRRLLEIKVSDSGIGIEKDQQEWIFERFRQGEAAISRRFGGTGLGLAIVKQLVELQGGSISCHSQPEQGSTFTVRIPYRLAPASGKEQLPAITPPTGRLPGFRRILLAEDNVLNRRIMALLFQEWNLNYDLARNGLEAIRLAERTNYDLIFLDINLPEMDGYRVARQLREELLPPRTVIIGISASSSHGERERCLQAGMTDYLPKPFRQRDLLDLLVRYGHANVSTTAAAPDQPGTPPAAGEQSLIDLEYLRGLANGKPERMREMADIFLEQIPKEYAQLKAAGTSKDLQTVATLAHGMRSTVAYMGMAHSLGPILQKLEEEAQQPGPARDLGTELEYLWCQLQSAMEQVRQQII
ncbi:ATP-binding protein [Flavilitoribacter nigricans]|uniref:histidine kinase n=1 Tax=Flavilitoribacter nigricans (strain ATCC 23147 / DSM 23189 / NBRC 102662 / NCIMB 1420 / SS-2) TaxID=1122177 RepID=A0A2D0NA97_FLAN2|nr:ATP-binding protein [Flavilitoribacter nigricans]PHN04703.1 hypothetical protein CRP01_19500 [Flavilitoribacter nigricans DSM 23189 = NBRC 102662]